MAGTAPSPTLWDLVDTRAMWVGVLRQRVRSYFGFGRSSGASARPRVLLVTLPLVVLVAVLVVLFRAGHFLLAVLVFALGWPLLAVGNRLARRP